MASAKPKSSSASRPNLPREVAGIADTFEKLREPALITTDAWKDGGVEIVAVNEAFAELSGYEADDLPGRNTRLFHGPKTELVATRATRSSETGEGWLHRRNGAAFYATWSFSPITREGAPTGYLLALYRDSSETRRLQEALLHSQKLDTVGQLAGGVAHDFNNLLSIINGYCEIMSGKLAAAPAAQKDLQEIHRAGLKAAGIARQILEFSRRQETESRAVNANTLIREIADILRRVVGDAIQVELRLASDLGNMRIDPTQFQQVLLNLCFNARDAMPRGGKLTVRTRRDAGLKPESLPTGLQAGPHVVLQVTDTGTGMNKATQKRIFEPFYTTKVHGTGLGLPTVLGIVKRAGGAISVQSEPGAGATFEIFLPETAESEQLFSTALTALPATHGDESVWLVESDDVLRKMVSGILSVDGYSVREFAAANEPLSAAPASTPELLIIDCTSASAPELVARLREQSPALRILNLSAEGPASILPDFPPKQVAHLPKPFALSTLLRVMRGLLDAKPR